MPWQQLLIALPAGDPAPVEDWLAEQGALAVTLEDAADDPVLEPLPGEMPLWREVRIKALFAEAAATAALSAALSERFGAVEHRWEQLADRVWERAWMDDFRPMRFGRLWVCPAGMSPDTGDDATVVRLDPGLAFGTGRHATTALCLEWLSELPLAGRCVLDFGCGSGLLAIAALRLGADRVLAVDIDEQALAATRTNAAANGVADRVELAGAPDAQRYDVVVANVLAGPLVRLAPTLAAALRPGGVIGLSGILEQQVDEVIAAYDPWVTPGPVRLREGWALLPGAREC